MSAKPALKGRKLWPEIESGGLEALYGLFSEEDFLLNQAVERFCASPDFAQNPSLNIEKFYASQNKPHQVLESALTMPFLGSKRLIILYEANLFKAAQLAEFLNYLDDPPPYTTLVFCGSKLDLRIKFSKQLKKKGKVEVLKKMWPKELLPWLKQRAELRGKSLEHGAAQRLAELSGLGLGALDSELEKLSLFVGAEQTITLKHVRQGVGAGRLHSIFDFTDALASEDLARALTAWDQLEALGEPAVRALAMVTRLIKQLVQVRGILDGGGSEGQVQSTLRTPPAATQTLLKRARREDQDSLAKALELALATDKALKSSPGADRVIMERLIMRLCHNVGKAKPAPSSRRAG